MEKLQEKVMTTILALPNKQQTATLSDRQKSACTHPLPLAAAQQINRVLRHSAKQWGLAAADAKNAK